MNAITISRVLDRDGDTIAFEIVANDGRIYFVSNDPHWEGMRVGPYPISGLERLERVEIARLEPRV